MATSILLLIIGFLRFAHGMVEYVVYPIDKRDVSACLRTNNALVKILGDSRVQIYQSQRRQTTEFWFVQALEVQKDILSYIPGVRILSQILQDYTDSSQVDAVMENLIVAQSTEESSTDASAFTIADATRSDNASQQLKLPLRMQRDAPQDLDLVSWPPRKRLPVFGNMPGYRYDVARGTDTYIYIIDNGINADNAVRSPIFTTHPFPLS